MNCTFLTLRFRWNPGSFLHSFLSPSESLFIPACVSRLASQYNTLRANWSSRWSRKRNKSTIRSQLMSQIWHDPYQHVPIWHPTNWGMVSNRYAGVLLDVCLGSGSDELIYIPHNLVHPVCVSHIFNNNNADMVLQNLSNSHHDAHLDLPSVPPPPDCAARS